MCKGSSNGSGLYAKVLNHFRLCETVTHSATSVDPTHTNQTAIQFQPQFGKIILSPQFGSDSIWNLISWVHLGESSLNELHWPVYWNWRFYSSVKNGFLQLESYGGNPTVEILQWESYGSISSKFLTSKTINHLQFFLPGRSLVDRVDLTKQRPRLKINLASKLDCKFQWRRRYRLLCFIKFIFKVWILVSKLIQRFVNFNCNSYCLGNAPNKISDVKST